MDLMICHLGIVICRDAVYRATLFGTFVTTKAVWPIMRQQGYGRILNCVSASGLYGNFGQVNYAAMKMGLVGFTKALHREGRPQTPRFQCEKKKKKRVLTWNV